MIISSTQETIFRVSDPKQADVVILSAGYDRTSSFGKGSAGGPKAIIGCLEDQIEFYDKFSRTYPRDHFKIGCDNSLRGLNRLAPDTMVQVVAKQLELYRDKFVVLVGGEHSVTNGPLQALMRIFKPNEVTVLQIDAHFDLRDTDADFHHPSHGKFSHACVMRRTYEDGFPIVGVGIRAYAQEELEFAKSKKSINFFEWGIDRILEVNKIIRSIKTSKVYITIDVDGFDPAHMPATGTPVQGGIEWYYGIKLLGEVFCQKDVVGFDIVEVAPRSNDNLTEYGAAQLLYSMLGFKVKKEQKLR